MRARWHGGGARYRVFGSKRAPDKPIDRLMGNIVDTPTAAGHRRLAWLPLATLVAALATLFLIGGERRHFYRGIQHDFQSSKSLTIAQHLSLRDHLRMFKRRYPGPDGEPRYEMYARFPIGGYALMKLAMLPFESLDAKILAARMLMLTFFSGTAILAYLALARLLRHERTGRAIALAATLLAFSSQIALYQSDSIDVEAIVSLFACLLAFHGVVAFALERRFGQLALKVAIALLLGWYVFGLLAAFIGIGVAGELRRAERARRASLVWRGRPSVMIRTLVRSRYLALGLLATLVGAALIGFNFAGEFAALGGDTAVADMPSVRSMLHRTGIATSPRLAGDAVALPGFLALQAHRVGLAVLPSLLTFPWDSADAVASVSPFLAIVGAVALAFCAWRLTLLRRRGFAGATPLAALTLTGVCWALAMSNQTHSPAHNYAGLLFIGVALTLYCVAGLWIAARWPAAAGRCALAAFAVFIGCVTHMSVANHNAAYHDEVMADFQAIRKRTRGKTVFVVASGSPRRYLGATYAMDFYLSGRVWQYSDREEESRREIRLGPDGSAWQSPPFAGAGAPDFIVGRDRFDIPALVTPRNKTVFLYDSLIDLAQAYRRLPILNTEPAARGAFDIHLLRRPRPRGNGPPRQPWRSARHLHELAYFKEPCAADDIAPRFLLHVTPRDRDGAAQEGGRGFENLDFDFIKHGVRLAGLCVATMPLPDYAIDRVTTGQFTVIDGTVTRLWDVEFAVDGPGAPGLLGTDEPPLRGAREIERRLAGRIRERAG